MKKKNRSLIYAIVVLAILYTVINIYIESGPVRAICNFINGILGVYVVITRFLSDVPMVRKMNYHLRKIRFFAILINEPEKSAPVSGQPFYKFKAALLSYTMDQLGSRTALINSPEVFKYDFSVEHEFSAGERTEDKAENWEDNLNGQFVFITGEAGGGKTFELIKRLNHVCKKLEAGLAKTDLLQPEKIPLYIELKSLDQGLDRHWIIDYVQKTASISNIRLNTDQLLSLIGSGDIIYFFDGLDEVNSSFREDCALELIELSKLTGVHVTCRKSVFNDLLKNNSIPLNVKPAEYNLYPVTRESIEHIIRAIPGKSVAEKEEMLGFIDGQPTLLSHMSRPIVLNLFVVVYQNLTPEQKEILKTGSESKTTDVLWENYEDIIYRKKLPKDSDMLGIRTITVWLAKIVKGASFYVESIQPEWLSKIDKTGITGYKMLQRVYYVVTRIFAAAVIGIAFGCIISTPFALLSNSILGGCVISILAGIYSIKLKKIRVPGWLSAFLFSLSMIVSLVAICGAYQGLAVPRAHEEMTNSVFSVTETWPGILLGMVLSIIFTYRIILEKKKRQYILPIELFHFDWPHAISYGLGWGLASGAITGSVALLVRHQYANAVLIQTWLVPRLEKIIRGFGLPVSSKNIDMAIFFYAFLITFFVASVIVILLAGRYNDRVEQSTKKKQVLNYGIRKSGKHAIIHAFKVALLTGSLYCCAMFGFGLGSLFYCVKISIGVSVLAFLWFGGMEVFNHIILRLNLYSRGIAPLNYNTWVQAQQDMGLIIPSGYQLTFYHSSLAGYYERYPVNDNPRIRLAGKGSRDVAVYTLILVIALGLVALPFLVRYETNWYWEKPSEFVTNFKAVSKQSDSTYTFDKTGIYQARTSGYILLGTFTGYCLAKGTDYGFMGMPLEAAYNVPGFEGFRHGALLLRTKNVGGSWSDYNYINTQKTIRAEKGEQLQFVVNDKEWQNNSGHYKVTLAFCDTCK